MRGHWVSTTRKLNKHYQSFRGFTPEKLINLSFDSIGIPFASDGWGYMVTPKGLYIYSSNSTFSTNFRIPAFDLEKHTGDIVPLFLIDMDSLLINGTMLDITPDTFNEPTGRLHAKIDNVTITLGDINITRRMMVVYINKASIPMQSEYITRYMDFVGAKFNTSIKLREGAENIVVYNGYCVTDNYDGEHDYHLGEMQYAKRFIAKPEDTPIVDSPPFRGSYIALSETPVEYAGIYTPFGGIPRLHYNYIADDNYYDESFELTTGSMDGVTPIYDNFTIDNFRSTTAGVQCRISGDGYVFDDFLMYGEALSVTYVPNDNTTTTIIGYDE